MSRWVRQPGVLALAIAAGLLQVASALRFEAPEYQGALVMGWAGALWLLYLGTMNERRASRRWEVIAGAALLALASAAALAVSGRYQPVHRVLALAAGAGIVLIAAGRRGLLLEWRAVLLVSLPLLDPLPAGVRRHLEPVRETAAAAAAFLHAWRFPVIRDGVFLRVPGATVVVLASCSGIEIITQLLALAIFVICLFPTTRWQKLFLAGSAVAAGFTVNAVRVAFLAVVASRAPDRWEFWERPGTGSHLFPVLATAAACLTWWLVLRRRLPGANVARD